jgi:pimeloyl-ACP methyl ester carboxylesterase
MDLTINGRRVFAATGGRAFDSALPTIVFVHGAGMDHTVWPLQARFFAHHGRSVLAVDLPGHGRSEGPALETIEAEGAWLLALLDSAGAKSTSLVGHSMGALAALEAAGQGGSRIAKLALLGISAPMSVHPELLVAAKAGQHVAMELVTAWGFGRQAHLGGNRAPGMWMLGEGLRLLEHGPAGVLGIDLAACNTYGGADAAAARVRCPTLILAGESDIMTPPAAGAALAKRFADARALTLPRAGHMMMIEQPDTTLDALKAFL